MKSTIITDEVLRNYKRSLSYNNVKKATYTTILSQIKKSKPIGLIDGKLIYVVNLGALMDDKTIKKHAIKGLKKTLPKFGLYPGTNDRLGLAFVSPSMFIEIFGIEGFENLPDEIRDIFADALRRAITDEVIVEVLFVILAVGVGTVAGMIWWELSKEEEEEEEDDDDDDDDDGGSEDEIYHPWIVAGLNGKLCIKSLKAAAKREVVKEILSIYQLSKAQSINPINVNSKMNIIIP